MGALHCKTCGYTACSSDRCGSCRKDWMECADCFPLAVERDALRADLDSLKAENERLKGQVGQFAIDRDATSNWVAAVQDQRDAARAEVERLNREIEMHGDKHLAMYAESDALRAALNRYGRHGRDCPVKNRYAPDDACTCGLDAALDSNS